ncbi:MAG: FtsX-like permease family protein [Candidatus Micrarchaeaceae archaeon]
MKLNDLLWLSYKDLAEKKIRTMLTVVMVMIGVASIIALTSLTAGISASVQSSLETLGPTSIILTGKAFTVSDTSELSSLPNVSAVIPILQGTGFILANGQNTSVSVIGISTTGLSELLGEYPQLYQGALYSDTISPTAVIGQSVAFPTSLAGRQNLRVGYPATLYLANGRSAEATTISIVGIMQPVSSIIVPVDSAVLMSLPAAQLLMHRTSYNIILVKASSTSAVGGVAQQITDIYGSSVSVTTTQEIAQTAASIIGSITILLVIIAGISLLVAAIGIMNIMLISVYEKTHDIGIYKSIGFRDRDVLLVFLMQALIIGFVGGTAGIATGAAGAYGLSFLASHSQSAGPAGATPQGAAFSGGYRGRTSAYSQYGTGGSGAQSISFSPVFAPATIALAMFVAIAVSAIAGVYPAWRASKLEPIEALRQL